MSILDRLRGRSDPGRSDSGQAAPAPPTAAAGAAGGAVRRYQSPPPVSDPLERTCLDALRTYLDDPVGHEFLILHADRERNAYVQFAATADRLQGEVSGDRFLATPLDDRSRQQRRLLGWADAADNPNPAQEWPYPVPLEVVAGVTARTLVEVFGLAPHERPDVELGGD